MPMRITMLFVVGELQYHDYSLCISLNNLFYLMPRTSKIHSARCNVQEQRIETNGVDYIYKQKLMNKTM